MKLHNCSYVRFGFLSVHCISCGDCRLAASPAPARPLTGEQFEELLAEFCD